MASTNLKLDFDGAVPDDLVSRISWVVATVCSSTPTLVRVDRTRHGFHVVVTVPRRVAPLSVVALQAILGSDHKREAYNLVRARNLRNVDGFWRCRFNVLYNRHNKTGEQ